MSSFTTRDSPNTVTNFPYEEQNEKQNTTQPSPEKLDLKKSPTEELDLNKEKYYNFFERNNNLYNFYKMGIWFKCKCLLA